LFTDMLSNLFRQTFWCFEAHAALNPVQFTTNTDQFRQEMCRFSTTWKDKSAG